MEVKILNDWFEWNGVRCTQYGIHVSEQPPMTMCGGDICDFFKSKVDKRTAFWI